MLHKIVASQNMTYHKGQAPFKVMDHNFFMLRSMLAYPFEKPYTYDKPNSPKLFNVLSKAHQGINRCTLKMVWHLICKCRNLPLTISLISLPEELSPSFLSVHALHVLDSKGSLFLVCLEQCLLNSTIAFYCNYNAK